MREWSRGSHHSTVFSLSEESRWSDPRCYNCNFCDREFKSAQALGGHMNVHRRDRALLRLSSDSNSSSTFLPPDNTPPLFITSRLHNSLVGEGLECLPEQPHSALPTSPDNRSTAPYPFFHFFDTSSSNSDSHGHNSYPNKADLCKFRSDVVYSKPFEFNMEQPPDPPGPSLSVLHSVDVVDLEMKMDRRAFHGHNVPNNVGLDLELRLGYTSSAQPSL